MVTAEMSLCSDLDFYLSSQETVGAILLTGPWGSGKTFFVKDYINSHKRDYAFGLVSLFGIDSSDAFHKRVKEVYFSNLVSINKALSKGKKIVGCLSNAVAESPVSTQKAASIAKGVSAIVSFDYLSLIEIKNSIQIETKKGLKDIRFVLVFDDFERCSIPVKELLGLINLYLETYEIKTIIIGAEDKADTKKYKEFKEKIVSKTILFHQSEKEIASIIIKNYKTGNEKYKKLLTDYSNEFLEAFIHSGYTNYRSLKCCLNDFERIVALISNEHGIEESDIKDLIYIFGARLYEAKSGNYQYNPEVKHFSLKLEKEKANEIKGKYRETAFVYTLYHISSWIVLGNWDETLIRDEIIQRYKSKMISPDMKLVTCPFYDLEQSDIDDYMPVVLDKAYKGELSRNDLISLLGTLHFLEQNAVRIPCKISYSKIEKGFDLRLSKIKNNEIIEPECHKFIENNQINKNAISLNRKIESLDNKIVHWNNRNRFISFFLGNSSIDSRQLYDGNYEEYDEEMNDAFINAFNSFDNSGRFEAMRIMNHSYFDNSSDDKSIKVSISNLKKLKEYLFKKKDTLVGSIDYYIYDKTCDTVSQKIRDLETTKKISI